MSRIRSQSSPGILSTEPTGQVIQQEWTSVETNVACKRIINELDVVCARLQSLPAIHGFPSCSHGSGPGSPGFDIERSVEIGPWRREGCLSSDVSADFAGSGESSETETAGQSQVDRLRPMSADGASGELGVGDAGDSDGDCLCDIEPIYSLDWAVYQPMLDTDCVFACGDETQKRENERDFGMVSRKHGRRRQPVTCGSEEANAAQLPARAGAEVAPLAFNHPVQPEPCVRGSVIVRVATVSETNEPWRVGQIDSLGPSELRPRPGPS